jgi:hypothetical protein
MTAGAGSGYAANLRRMNFAAEEIAQLSTDPPGTLPVQQWRQLAQGPHPLAQSASDEEKRR